MKEGHGLESFWDKDKGGRSEVEGKGRKGEGEELGEGRRDIEIKKEVN